MYKKIMISLLLVLFTSINSWAGNVQTVTINGEAVDKTVCQISFSGDNVVLTFSDGTHVTQEMSQVSITFSQTNDTATSALEIFSYGKVVGDKFIVGNISDKTPIAIYNAAGVRCLQTVATSSSQQVDISHLKTGVYLLRIDKQVVKFVKR